MSRKRVQAQKSAHVAQAELKLAYKGDPLTQFYKPDFVCFGKIIVELKAVKAIAPEHEAQLLHYLKMTGMKLGVLVNFGSYPQAQVERRIL
jgi:GxxExxY protein